MKFKIFALGFLLTTLFFSCKKTQDESNTENPEINTIESSEEVENEISKVDREVIIQNLKGKWKEPEYPFRVAEFTDSLVKFIEEGIVEEPRFRPYKISKECPFEVNNLKNIGKEDIILVMKESVTCEKIKISNDSLTLTGFNINTETEYQIVYIREE